MFLLYSTEPRRSATGSVASAAACAAAAMTSSAPGRACDRIADLADGAPEPALLHQGRAGEHFLRRGRPDRCKAEVGEAHTGLRHLAAVVERQVHGHTRDRVVADLALQLQVRAATLFAGRTKSGGRRNVDFGQDLAGVERRREEAVEEVVDARSCAGRPGRSPPRALAEPASSPGGRWPDRRGQGCRRSWRGSGPAGRRSPWRCPAGSG